MQSWIKIPRAGKLGLLGLVVLAAVLAITVSPWAGPKNSDNDGGRLSPASLDVDTCGCPSEFFQPFCDTETSWTLEKTTTTGNLTNPTDANFSFTVNVTKDSTGDYLYGEGKIVVTNSGEQPAALSSIVISLEDQVSDGTGDAYGPSGQNWKVLGTATAVKYEACSGQARTCYGDILSSDGAELKLFQYDEEKSLGEIADIPPTVDNDGDGLRDEDPLYTGLNDTANSCGIIDNDGDGLFDEDPADETDNDNDGEIDEDPADDDGDGLTDEDGACEDAVVIYFEYRFDITGFGINGPGDGVVPSADDLRINMFVTFDSGEQRGGTCKTDVDCDGDDERDVRSVQQRLQFDPVECTPKCDTVDLTDSGPTADPAGCVDLDTTTNTANGTLSDNGTFGVAGTVSCQGGLGAFALALPDSVTMSVKYPVTGGPAYFPTTTVSGGTSLDGTYLGWCIDTDRVIYQNTPYTASVYSSYEGVPGWIVENPQNLDLVNYIINQGYVGKNSPGCSGTYTYGDVQRAIWTLIDDNVSTSGLGSWSQCRANEILAAANANGDGFKPGCNDKVAVILVPNPNAQDRQVIIAQVNFIELGVPCEPCETIVTNEATLTCSDDQSLVSGSPASANFAVSCGQ